MNPIPVITLLFILWFASQSEAHDDIGWEVMTAHVYPEQGIELRIISHGHREVDCVIEAPNGVELVRQTLSLTPLVSRHMIEYRQTRLIYDYRCELVTELGKLPPIRASPIG